MSPLDDASRAHWITPVIGLAILLAVAGVQQRRERRLVAAAGAAASPDR